MNQLNIKKEGGACTSRTCKKNLMNGTPLHENRLDTYTSLFLYFALQKKFKENVQNCFNNLGYKKTQKVLKELKESYYKKISKEIENEHKAAVTKEIENLFKETDAYLENLAKKKEHINGILKEFDDYRIETSKKDK